MKPCNFSFFSLSEKSERDLFTSERENGWWVAYGSTTSWFCTVQKLNAVL